MCSRWLVTLATGFILLLGLSAAQVANLTGTWRLNTEKSKWGKKPKPYAILVQVEHSEPNLKYGGMVTDGAGDPARHFDFNGVIDGKEHAQPGGTVIVNRVDPRTISSVFRSEDGSSVFSATTTVSPDGNTLKRTITSEDSNGKVSWTEVYEKQP